MQSISDLNKKWWYRLIKVIYVFSLCFFLIAPVVGVFYAYEPRFDSLRTYALCDDGRHMELLKNRIALYSEYVWSDDDKKIRLYCASDQDLAELATFLKYAGITTKPTPDQIRANLDIYAQKISLDDKNYQLKAAYYPRDWVSTIGFSLLSIVVALGSFEIVRRIFYYILLGKLRPNKT